MCEMRHLSAVATLAALALALAACTRVTPTPTPIVAIVDAYGNQVPYSAAMDVLYAASEQAMSDAGLESTTCLALYGRWRDRTMVPENAASIPRDLAGDVARRLRRGTARETRVVDDPDTATQCADGNGAVWVMFEYLVQSEDRLWAAVTVGCGVDCWGNSGATYIFGQRDGKWVLEETTGAWAS